MKTFFVAVFLSAAAAANAQWQSVGPGVDFQEFKQDNQDVYVTRIDLTNDKIAVVTSRQSEKGTRGDHGNLVVVTSRQSEKGTRVSDFGRRNKALAAINGDYFDEKFNPV